jgi:hypothetical protein
MAAWIRIRIPNEDPQEGQKSKKKGKNAAKNQIIRHKSIKCKVIDIRIDNCDLIYIKNYR